MGTVFQHQKKTNEFKNKIYLDNYELPPNIQELVKQNETSKVDPSESFDSVEHGIYRVVR